MLWAILYHDSFVPELDALPEEAKDGVLAMGELLMRSGPTLGRPHVDTLAGSRHPNMKEMRFNTADGAWRIAFAFDPKRRAIILVGGDKAGVAQRRFYKALITKADARFDEHLDSLKG